MQLHEFYQLLKSAIQYIQSESNRKIDTLQTFAVVERISDISTEALTRSMHSRHKPFIYAKKWAQLGGPEIKWEYPILVAYEMPPIYVDPFGKPTIRHRVELSALYPNVEQVEGDYLKYCEQLEAEEIRQRMEKLLFGIIGYLKDVRVYEKEGEQRYANKQVIDMEEIPWRMNRRLSDLLQSDLWRNTQDGTQGKIVTDFEKDKVCGVSMLLSFTDRCPTKQYNIVPPNCC